MEGLSRKDKIKKKKKVAEETARPKLLRREKTKYFWPKQGKSGQQAKMGCAQTGTESPPLPYLRN